MPDALSRRDFLKITAAGATVTLAASGAQAMAAAPAARETPGGIAVRVTDASRKFTPGPAIEWTRGTASEDAIRLDPAKRFQTHLGIGGAFTDAACYTFHRLGREARAHLFHEMFHPDEMGLSVGRVPVGASDYSTRLYSYDEGAPDPELKRFSIAHDRRWILPILREARALNPNLWLLASPWSPPGWMKPNGSMLGGCMHPKTMRAYANYLVKFLEAYRAEGVRIDSLTPQNEVDTEQDGRMPACAWPQEYEMGFVRDHLGPALRRRKLDTKIWMLDHNYNLWGRAICMLEDPDVREFTSGIAWHGYVGEPEMIEKVREAHPEIEMFWTEGGPDITQKDYATDWANWGETFSGILRHHCRTIIGWNLALDENGRPNMGPFDCGGTVTIHSRTNQIVRSGQFWAMNHFARTVRPGARRFDSQGRIEGVEHVAYENTGGERALVLTNPGKPRTVHIEMAGNMARVALGSDSITSLIWK